MTMFQVYIPRRAASFTAHDHSGEEEETSKCPQDDGQRFVLLNYRCGGGTLLVLSLATLTVGVTGGRSVRSRTRTSRH